MSSIIGYYKKTLIHLFTELHRLESNPLELHLCLEIQEILISKITYIERRIRKLRAACKVLKRTLATPQSRLDRSQALITKDHISQLEASVSDYKSLLHIFRCIGDGLAFVYIDRFDIKPMSFKEDPGFISRKKGNKLERKILRSVFLIGGVAILNDLTHSLRYGDLFVWTEKGRFLLEVKSGRHKDERAKRQIEDIQSILNYLNDDETHEHQIGDYTVFRRVAFTELKDLHDDINLVICKKSDPLRQIEG